RLPYGSLKLVFVDQAYETVQSYASVILASVSLLHLARIVDQAIESGGRWHWRWRSSFLVGCYIGMQTFSDAWLPQGISGHIAALYQRKVFGHNEYRNYISDQMSQARVLLDLAALPDRTRNRPRTPFCLRFPQTVPPDYAAIYRSKAMLVIRLLGCKLARRLSPRSSLDCRPDCRRLSQIVLELSLRIVARCFAQMSQIVTRMSLRIVARVRSPRLRQMSFRFVAWNCRSVLQYVLNKADHPGQLIRSQFAAAAAAARHRAELAAGLPAIQPGAARPDPGLTGKNMQYLLDQWVTQPGHARLRASFSINKKRNLIALEIRDDPPVAASGGGGGGGGRRRRYTARWRLQELDGPFTHTLKLDESAASATCPVTLRVAKLSVAKCCLATETNWKIRIWANWSRTVRCCGCESHPEMQLIRHVEIVQPEPMWHLLLRYERCVASQMAACRALCQPCFHSRETWQALMEWSENEQPVLIESALQACYALCMISRAARTADPSCRLFLSRSCQDHHAPPATSAGYRIFKTYCGLPQTTLMSAWPPWKAVVNHIQVRQDALRWPGSDSTVCNPAEEGLVRHQAVLCYYKQAACLAQEARPVHPRCRRTSWCSNVREGRTKIAQRAPTPPPAPADTDDDNANFGLTGAGVGLAAPETKLTPTMSSELQSSHWYQFWHSIDCNSTARWEPLREPSFLAFLCAADAAQCLLCLLSLLLNSLSYLALGRDGSDSTLAMQLRSLAVTDVIYVLANTIDNFCHTLETLPAPAGDSRCSCCRFSATPLSGASGSAGHCAANLWFSRRRTRNWMGAIWIVAMATSLVRGLEVTSVLADCPDGFNRMAVVASRIFPAYTMAVNFGLQTVTPVVAVMVVNVLLLRTVRRSNNFQRDAAGGGSSPNSTIAVSTVSMASSGGAGQLAASSSDVSGKKPAAQKQEKQFRQLTRMVTLLMYMYLICQTPMVLYGLCFDVPIPVVVSFKIPTNLYIIMTLVGNVISSMDGTCNFFIYVVTNPKFKREVRQILGLATMNATGKAKPAVEGSALRLKDE
uniref:G_PROTEIN_RECEP_F1_2 domain-containing protein n=1 Tax=Macrostomum lignano TaxID=282301 RepID=A0A1I8FN30_9PLAT